MRRNRANESLWIEWTEKIRSKPGLLGESEAPKPNAPSVRKSKEFAKLFETEIPAFIPGFECHDREKMEELWPAGIQAARAVSRVVMHVHRYANHCCAARFLTDSSKQEQGKTK